MDVLILPALPFAAPRGEVIVGLDVENAWRRFAPMVRRRCARLLKDDAEADDATQEVFVKLVLHGARLDERAPSRLLWTMATNECLSRLRRRKRRPEQPRDEAEELLLTIAGTDDVERDVLVHRALQSLFATTPAALRASTRAIAVWHWVDGMTLDEVAEAAGLSVSGVRKRLRTLRAVVFSEASASAGGPAAAPAGARAAARGSSSSRAPPR